MTENNAPQKPRRRRSAPLLWASGALAAVVLVLGVNGTLSSWSTAIIHNNTDTFASASAVALAEYSGTDTTVAACVDTSSAATNEATCSTINKYGGTSTPLIPGGTQSATVTLKNTGTGAGDLTLTADTPSTSGGSSPSPDLAAEATVKVECPTGTSKQAAITPATFATATATTPLALGSLAAGASITCTFTVALPSSAPATYASQTVSQALNWTLTASA